MVANNLVELAEAGLDGLQDMSLKLGKRVLDLEHVRAVVVFFNDLLVQAVVDTSLEDVGILLGSYGAAAAIESRCVGPEKFDVFLGLLACFVDELASFTSTLGQLLVLVLDLGM